MEKLSFSHNSVLLRESIDLLNVKPSGLYVDGTAGGGGHSMQIAQKLASTGRLIAIDRDPEAVQATGERLKAFSQVRVVQANYSELTSILAGEKADGILLDLGVSSHQLDTGARGFSYHEDALLDMRMGTEDNLTAADVVNTYSQGELAKIFREYGEEKFARQIATNIVKTREVKPVTTTKQLAEIISASVPFAVKRDKNPCKKTFQALRIEVNKEFEHLQKGLDSAVESLKSGGRLAVITFHSLEDRIVKQKFSGFVKPCSCPVDFPVCTCGKLPVLKLITKKPIVPSADELAENVRCRSAKLRVAEKL